MVRIDARVGSESRRRPIPHYCISTASAAGPFRRSPGDTRASVAAAVKKRFMHSSDQSGAGRLQAWPG